MPQGTQLQCLRMGTGLQTIHKLQSACTQIPSAKPQGRAAVVKKENGKQMDATTKAVLSSQGLLCTALGEKASLPAGHRKGCVP